MGYLIVPLIFGIISLPDPSQSPDRLADFARLRKAVGEVVYLTDGNGQERRLTLLEAGEHEVTLSNGAQSIVMQKDAVFTVDRARDRTIDGLLKGAAIGLVMGLLVESEIPGSDGSIIASGMLAYGTVGYLLDRASTARQPLYRGRPSMPASTHPAASIRFRF
jgi:hypothetical protein